MVAPITKRFDAAGVGRVDNWALGAGASKQVAVNADDGDTSHIEHVDNRWQDFDIDTTFTPTFAHISAVRVRGTIRFTSTPDGTTAKFRIVVGGSTTEYSLGTITTETFLEYISSSIARPGGGDYTNDDLVDTGTNRFQFGIYMGSDSATLRCTELFVEIDGIPLNRTIDLEREVASRKLWFNREPEEVIQVVNGWEALEAELMDPIGFSHAQGPTHDGKGWGLKGWERGSGRLRSQVISLSSPRVLSTIVNRRRRYVTYWETMKLTVSGDSDIADGLARLDGAGADREFSRTSKAWVEDLGGVIRQIDEAKEKIEPRGTLIEGAATNLMTRSSFNGGVSGNWTLVQETGTGALADDATDLLFEDTVSDGSAKVTATSADYRLGITRESDSLDGNKAYNISIDWEIDNNAVMKVSLQNPTGPGFWLAPGGGWSGSQKFVDFVTPRNSGYGGNFYPVGAPDWDDGPDSVTAPMAVDLDGTNDYYKFDFDLNDIADSKKGIFSCWVRLDGDDGSRLILVGNTDAGVQIYRESDDKFYVRLENAAGTIIAEWRTVSTFTASASWIHVLASWDLATQATNLYIDDVSENEVAVAAVDDIIDYTKAAWGVGATDAGGGKLNGALSQLYFAPGEYLDFPVEFNRRSFIESDGATPVPLGKFGELPLDGVSPALMMFNRTKVKQRDNLTFITGDDAGTYTVYVYFVGPTSGTIHHVYHVQIETGAWATSRIVTEASAVTRAPDSLLIKNDSTLAQRVFPVDRFTVRVLFTPPWNSSDISSALTIVRLFHDANNGIYIQHSDSTTLRVVYVHAGTNEVASISSPSLVAFREYEIVIRRTTSSGELGETNNTLTIFLAGVKGGTEDTIPTDLTEAASSVFCIGALSAITGFCDGWIGEIMVSPIVFSDEEIAGGLP